jgi:hypothetical protein
VSRAYSLPKLKLSVSARDKARDKACFRLVEIFRLDRLVEICVARELAELAPETEALCFCKRLCML